MKTKDGEYIEMLWEDGLSEFEIVKGWPGEEATRKAIEDAGCNTAREWAFRECYAANLQTATSREQDYACEIRLFKEPGRGRYKVSVLEPNNTDESRTAPVRTPQSAGSVPTNSLGVFAAHSRQGPVDSESLDAIIQGPVTAVQPAFIADRAKVQHVDDQKEPNTNIDGRISPPKGAS